MKLVILLSGMKLRIENQWCKNSRNDRNGHSCFSKQSLTFTRLKKWLIISMLFVYLSANTQLHEIFKLPVLIEHFLEHHHANKHLSFFDFLKMHYANGNKRYADYDEDMKLPFKSADACDFFVAAFSMLPKYPHIKQPVHVQVSEFVDFHNFSFGTAVSNAIWQPPKTA